MQVALRIRAAGAVFLPKAEVGIGIAECVSQVSGVTGFGSPPGVCRSVGRPPCPVFSPKRRGVALGCRTKSIGPPFLIGRPSSCARATRNRAAAGRAKEGVHTHEGTSSQSRRAGRGSGPGGIRPPGRASLDRFDRRSPDSRTDDFERVGSHQQRDLDRERLIATRSGGGLRAPAVTESAR